LLTDSSSARIKPTEKNRPANKTQRFEKGPALVHKLGHFGVRTTNYAKAYEFYTSRFNLIASDVSRLFKRKHRHDIT
jgi:hypothetical protein